MKLQADPAEGQQWWADSDVQDGGGRLYIYTGEEWVDTSLPEFGADLMKQSRAILKLDASALSPETVSSRLVSM